MAASRLLALLLVFYLLLGVSYSLATPILEASDEIWHYAVVRELVLHRRLPVQEVGVETPWAQEGSQPPLYYVLAALLTGWIDTSDYPHHSVRNPFPQIGIPGATANRNLVAHPPGQSPLQGGTVLAVYLIRWLSLLLGAGTVAGAYRLALSLAPSRPPLALLTAALVAFNPMVLFIHSAINNDNLVMVLTTWVLVVLVTELKTEEAQRWPRRTLGLGLLIGLAALTKVSGLVLLPTAVLALGLSPSWRRRPRIGLLRLALLCVVVGLVAGWWYVRNWRLYGEWLGLARMALIAGPRPAGFGLRELAAEWQGFWYSFWGVFGAFNLLAPAWFYRLWGGLSLLAALGLAVAAVRRRKQQRPRSEVIPHLVLVVFLGLTFIGVVRWTLLTTASQGRLLFGGIAALGLYMACGLLAWWPRGRCGPVAAGIGAGLALLATVIPFGVLQPAYRPPTPLSALPADAIPLAIRFGDEGEIELAGYRLEQSQTQAGAPLPVTLYWRSTRPITAFYQLALNGYGYEKEHVAKLDTWPGGGLRPTAYWQPGVLYPDPYHLPTDPTATTPTVLKLQIAFHTDLLQPAADRMLPMTVAGEPVQAVLLDAGDLVGPLPPTPPSTAPLAELEHGLQLLAYRLRPTPQGLSLELEWTTTAAVPVAYQVFAHLVDGQGQVVAQADAPPRRGYWPTDHWRPGEVVASEHAFVLPEDLPAATYTLQVGMYELSTLARAAAYDENGRRWPEDAVVLTTFVRNGR
jgi:4-amino-4-deoxy-L-arabinose transferase-like glycosyltransferase